VKLTLVLPAHNEGPSIYQTLMEIDASMPSSYDVTVFVSEDGSKDDTRYQVDRAATDAKHVKIRLSRESPRLGYSKAVQRGIQETDTELICFMDADGQYNPKDILRLYGSLSPNEIVIGYRNHREDSRIRIIYSRAFGYAYRFFGGPKLKDPSSPLTMARLRDIEFLGQINCRLDYGFWWEFQYRVNHRGLAVKEIPVAHRARKIGNTQVYTIKRMPKLVFKHLLGLYELRKELRN
jgi:glycosyltransferase involved in cell wall biosynthesis